MQSTTQPKSKAKPKASPSSVHKSSAEEVEIQETSEDEGSVWDLIEGQHHQIAQLENHQGARITNLECDIHEIVGQLRELTCHLKGPVEQ